MRLETRALAILRDRTTAQLMATVPVTPHTAAALAQIAERMAPPVNSMDIAALVEERRRVREARSVR